MWKEIFNSRSFRIGVGIIAVLLLCWGSYRYGKAVSDTGGVREVNEQFRRVEQAQQDIKNSADNIEQGARRSQQTADEAASRVENARQSVSDAQIANNRAGELIEDCQRILREVHARGTENKAEN